jgi:hypothetical protein
MSLPTPSDFIQHYADNDFDAPYMLVIDEMAEMICFVNADTFEYLSMWSDTHDEEVDFAMDLVDGNLAQRGKTWITYNDLVQKRLDLAGY